MGWIKSAGIFPFGTNIRFLVDLETEKKRQVVLFFGVIAGASCRVVYEAIKGGNSFDWEGLVVGDRATLTRNVVRLGRDRLTAILATPTPTQHRALDLLGVTLAA